VVLLFAVFAVGICLYRKRRKSNREKGLDTQSRASLMSTAASLSYRDSTVSQQDVSFRPESLPPYESSYLCPLEPSYQGTAPPYEINGDSLVIFQPQPGTAPPYETDGDGLVISQPQPSYEGKLPTSPPVSELPEKSSDEVSILVDDRQHPEE